MTTELVLLLSIFVFALMGIFLKIPKETFYESGPRLGVRIEQQITTGSGFKYKGKGNEWRAP